MDRNIDRYLDVYERAIEARPPVRPRRARDAGGTFFSDYESFRPRRERMPGLHCLHLDIPSAPLLKVKLTRWASNPRLSTVLPP